MTQANKVSRYFYAMSDTFTGDNPREYSTGVANTKIPIAFRSRDDRDKWLQSTKLTTAKAITRREAVKMVTKEKGEFYGCRALWVKACRIYTPGTAGRGEGTDRYSCDHVILAESVN